MTKMNDHLMVEDPMPWDHLALDQGSQKSNGYHSRDDRGDEGLRDDHRSRAERTGSDRRRR